ncbi:hypothetical protein GMES_2261 [Paraglaciecola mesophila KMM 241]|uniref:Uncharacterized protein n=1 Tax=Paraglaciecola mesophila KMM 241 TaxID=1128912 RepID=K6Z2D4_9ALTE|nr:hypothetical protein GMES_2261 [Paraglaciecola mesophila KMM 241]
MPTEKRDARPTKVNYFGMLKTDCPKCMRMRYIILWGILMAMMYFWFWG